MEGKRNKMADKSLAYINFFSTQGAIWHIYPASDADKLRAFLRKVSCDFEIEIAKAMYMHVHACVPYNRCTHVYTCMYICFTNIIHFHVVHFFLSVRFTRSEDSAPSQGRIPSTTSFSIWTLTSDRGSIRSMV